MNRPILKISVLFAVLLFLGLPRLLASAGDCGAIVTATLMPTGEPLLKLTDQQRREIQSLNAGLARFIETGLAELPPSVQSRIQLTLRTPVVRRHNREQIVRSAGAAHYAGRPIRTFKIDEILQYHPLGSIAVAHEFGHMTRDVKSSYLPTLSRFLYGALVQWDGTRKSEREGFGSQYAFIRTHYSVEDLPRLREHFSSDILNEDRALLEAVGATVTGTRGTINDATIKRIDEDPSLGALKLSLSVRVLNSLFL